MTTRKKLMLAVVLVVGLPLAALAVLRLTVDPAAFAPRIEAFVQEATGLTLRLSGPIRLSFFPWIGLEVEQASLGGLTGFESDPFVSLRRAVIKARLGALLQGRLEADAVRLDGLDVTLIRARDGRANWQALPVRQVSLEEDTVVVETETSRTAFRYLIAGVILKNANVTFEDRAAGRTLRVTDIEATTGRIAPGAESAVSLSGRLIADSPRLSVRTALTGRLSVVPSELRFAFGQAKLSVEADAPGLPFHRLTGTGRADVNVQGQDGRIRVHGLDLAATAAGGMFPEAGETAKLSGSLDYDATAGTLTVADLRLSGLGLSLTGRVDGTLGKPGTPPRVVWQFATDSFNPAKALATLGLRPASLPQGGLTSLTAKGKAVYSPSNLSLDLEQLRLDGQNIVFTAAVTDFNKPAIRFSLTADALDLDRYLAADAGKAGSAPKPAAQSEAATALPRLDGTIAVGRLTAKKLTLTDLRATIHAADGRLAVKPWSVGLAGGNIAGALTVTTAGAAPRWHSVTAVNGVGLGPVLAAVTGRTPVSGALWSKADLTAAGTTPQALTGSLAGTASLRLTNGVIHGFSVSPALIASLKSLLGLVELSPTALVSATGAVGQALVASRQGQTRLNRASAGFRFTAGRGTTRDLLVVIPQAKVTGAGSVDLGRSRLDLAILADVREVGTVPLTVSGPLTAPEVGVDKTELAKRALLGLPQRLGKSVRDGGGAIDAIKGFFGGSN